MISIACQIINCDLGRVLNRFSKDIGYMDDQLQVMFSLYLVVITLCSIINCIILIYYLQLFSYLTGICVLAVVASYWNIIPVMFMFVIFFIIRWLYVTASRDLKRLEALCKIACIHGIRSYISLLSSQSHLFSSVHYSSRSTCHSLLLNAVFSHGEVPCFSKQEHTGLVPVYSFSEVDISIQ